MKIFLVKIILNLWGLLPFSAVHRLGNVIGSLLYLSKHKLYRTTQINIKHCYPELTSQQQQQLIKHVLKEKAKELTESPAIWTKSHKALLKQFTHFSGVDALLNDFNKQRGVILLGAHMGAFYLVNAYLGPKTNGTWLYKPQKGIIEDLMKDRRQAYGAHFVPTNKTGVMTIARSLQKGGLIGMSCDHDAGKTGGLFAPFFSISAWTMGLPARLANKTKAPVYFIFLQRLKPGKGFHLHAIPVDNDIYDNDITIATSAMNKTLEQCVRQYPAQYDWTYKRFRRQPDGKPAIY